MTGFHVTKPVLVFHGLTVKEPGVRSRGAKGNIYEMTAADCLEALRVVRTYLASVQLYGHRQGKFLTCAPYVTWQKRTRGDK